jgi:hypothetical protein
LQGKTTTAIERNDQGRRRKGGIVALIGVTTATYLCAASFLSDYMSP